MTMFAYVHILGDALALLSALFYALYVTLLKVRIRSESRIDMQLFFGFVGLFNILTCWPIGILLHITGVERFEMPYTSKAVLALLINVSTSLFVYAVSHARLARLDGNHSFERLHICDRHAQDYTLSGYDRP